MKLIVGLGNIDAHFAGTRHNVGFAITNILAEEFGLVWQQKDKFKGTIAEGAQEGQKIMLLQPGTYYNASGEAVIAVKNFYKIDVEDILVIHDELALPFGTVRTRLGGSDAGNNGIKSVIASIGPGFARVRVGIANRLSDRQASADFVLSRFTHTENKKMPDLAAQVGTMVRGFLLGEFDHKTIVL